MCPGPMVVSAERLQVAVQAGFVQDDDVVQTFSANGTDDPLDIGALPWRTWRRQHLLDSHRLHLLDEVMAKDAVAVAQKIARRTVPRKRLPELLSSPLGSRVCGHSEMQNSAAVMREHQKHVQDLKPDGRHGEEVERHDALQVIVEERPPGLGRRSSVADHVFTNTGFADLDAELEQLAMNAWSPPEWIFTAHR